MTFSTDVMAACRPHASIPVGAHLMVDDPDPWLEDFARAGCDMILVHVEACRHLHRTLTRLRGLGVKAGVALNPATHSTPSDTCSTRST
jgi:ribulose-phosphate 3-epimerase